MITAKKLKKNIALTLIVCVGIAAVLGLAVLFVESLRTGTVGKIFLTLLIIVVSGLFLLTSVEAIARKNIFGLIAFGLIGVSAVMYFLLVWTSVSDSEGFTKFVVILSMASILFDMIVGNVVELGKKMFLIQMVAYLTFLYVEIAVSLAILDNSKLLSGGLLTVFIAMIIVFLAMFFILKIKKRDGSVQAETNSTPRDEENTVVLPKKEYQKLLDRIEELETQLKLKN